MEISGFVAPGSVRVRAQFERNFVHHAEVGASVCVYQGETCGVGCWGGIANPTAKH